jgi:hypothetical protein
VKFLFSNYALLTALFLFAKEYRNAPSPLHTIIEVMAKYFDLSKRKNARRASMLRTSNKMFIT